jgi:hypothetical protein
LVLPAFTWFFCDACYAINDWVALERSQAIRLFPVSFFRVDFGRSNVLVATHD